jgi:hypothetical protein
MRPFSDWGDATAILSRKKSTTLNSWRVVIASWSRWWEKRHYELKVGPAGDRKVIFFYRIAVASPQWENGLLILLIQNLLIFKINGSAQTVLKDSEQLSYVCMESGKQNTVANYQRSAWGLLIVTATRNESWNKRQNKTARKNNVVKWTNYGMRDFCVLKCYGG